MGIDIIAYKGLKPVTAAQAVEGDEFDLKDGHVRTIHSDEFPGRADDLINRGYYSYTESQHFFGSAYSGYNRWRDQLAKIAGYALGSYRQYEKDYPSYAATVWDDPKPGPFMELINFSDCEGIIGTAMSKKLAADFAEYQERADKENAEFIKGYNGIRAAFEFASDNGFVRFG